MWMQLYFIMRVCVCVRVWHRATIKAVWIWALWCFFSPSPLLHSLHPVSVLLPSFRISHTFAGIQISLLCCCLTSNLTPLVQLISLFMANVTHKGPPNKSNQPRTMLLISSHCRPHVLNKKSSVVTENVKICSSTDGGAMRSQTLT